MQKKLINDKVYINKILFCFIYKKQFSGNKYFQKTVISKRSFL